MDLLFKRYASPFILIEETIRTGRFNDFIDELRNIISDEEEDRTMWEYYLHRVFDKSYEAFVREVKRPRQPEKTVDFETTIKESYSILKGFNPNK